MDKSYVSLIEHERAKIALLKAKIAECERRIQALQSFLDADDLDDFLTKTVAHEADFQENVRRTAVANELQDASWANTSPLTVFEPKKKLSASALAVLHFIGPEGKSLDELEAFSALEGLKLNRGALRSFASNYKGKYGFLASPKLGFFQLTERGKVYLSKHASDVKSETPSVGAEGVSFTSNQAAGSGTESDDDL